jgi:hypothetical protein
MAKMGGQFRLIGLKGPGFGSDLRMKVKAATFIAMVSASQPAIM